jgi:poly(3-hydroxybutyrate) depolymerase
MQTRVERAMQFVLMGLVYCLGTAGVAQAGGLRWHETSCATPQRCEKLLVLENDLVNITFLPQAGGRVVRYLDQTTGVNQLRESADLEAEDAGGIWDKEGVWPPSNICNHPFAYRVEEAPDHLEVVFEADLGNLTIAKKYRLDSASSRLALEAIYQNTGTIPIRTLFTQVFSLAPGGRVGNQHFVVYPDADGLVKQGFGSSPKLGPDSLSPSWWMVSDSERGVSLLLTVEPNPLLAERAIGSSESAVELELHTRRHLSKPGEVLTLRWDMRLIKHARDVERACAEGCFLPESERNGMIQSLSPLLGNFSAVFRDMGEHLLVLPWGFASLSVPHRVVRQPGPLQVELRAMRLSEESTKAAPSETLCLQFDGKPSAEFPLHRLDSGAAETRYVHIPTVNLIGGRHSLELAAEGRAIHTSFAVINERAIAERIQSAQKRSAELAQQARHAGDAARIAAAASCEMRAEDARRKFIMGPEFEEWGNTAQAADVNALPLKLNPETRPADVEYILRVLAEAESWIEALAAGRDPFQERKGLFEKAFYSRVDGSLQPYTVFVPKDYDGKSAWPLLLLLHGSGGDQWEITQAAANLDGRSVFRGALEEKEQEPRFLLCAPLARGPSGYEQIAEVDVLQTLEEVQRDYRVDPDRVYALGWSMGGAGSFLMATRFPDRFAAVMPIAGSMDTELIANARYVPCWNFHELGDREVSPGFTNVAESAYHSLGLPYHAGIRDAAFVWSPWSDHWVGYRMSGSLNEIEGILGTYRRNRFPKEVTLISTELRHNRAYWVRVDSFERYSEPARLQARLDGNTIEISSTNVRAFTLFLSPNLLDMSSNVRVKQNGQLVYAGKPEAEVRVGSPVTPGLHKEQGLSGPLSDIFYEPFLVVYGTQGDDKQEIDAARKEAEAIRTKGLRGVRFYAVPIKSDHEVTAADIEKFHLLLVGTAKSNLLLSRLENRLPVRVESGAVVAGDRRFAGEDVGYRLIYPNPLNPLKYVVVCAAVTYKGLAGLSSIPMPNFGWNARVTEPDVVVTDPRANGLYPRYLAAWVFDNQWQLEDRGTVVARLETPLSRAGIECTWGDFRADAIRQAARADVALVEVDDHLYPQELSAGPVSWADLSMANNYAPIYTFQATGAELRDGLEHAIERYLRSLSDLEERFRSGDSNAAWWPLTRRPLAVSGFSYAFSRSRPEGERVEVNGLEPQKLYRVAVTERVLSQSVDGNGGIGYLGWLPKIQPTRINEIAAQERYLREHNPATPIPGERITEY